jgi:hypothetical protein
VAVVPAAATLEAAGPPGDERRGERADRRRLGGREDPAVDAADDHQEDQHDRPHVDERAQPLAPRQPGARRRLLGRHARDDADHDHVADGRDDAGNERGHEELRDVLLGQDRVDHERH